MKLMRSFVGFVLLVTVSAAHAQPIDLDSRIRPRPDGSYFLPGPFGGDLTLHARGTFPLECAMVYGFYMPDPQCSGDLTCGPQVITPGLGFALGLALGDLPCGLLSARFQSSCDPGDQTEAEVAFLQGPHVERCVVCTLALMFWLGRLGPFPAECDFPAAICGGDSPALPDGPAFPAGAVTRGTGTSGMITVFRALRDILARSAAGQRWIALYDQHSPALVHAVPLRPWLIWMISDALGSWLPAVQALVNGQGASATITPAMMTDWLAILDELQAAVPADTATAMQEERTRLDLPSYVGLTMEQALARFEGAGGTTCGDGFAGADCALAELLLDDLCGSDAIESGLLAFIEARVGKARLLLQRAAAGGKPGKVRRLVKKSSKQLVKLGRKVKKAKDTSATCRTQLDGMVTARRQQVLALGP